MDYKKKWRQHNPLALWRRARTFRTSVYTQVLLALVTYTLLLGIFGHITASA